jgi:D-3-phosphoglycerate dehydrogenase
MTNLVLSERMPIEGMALLEARRDVQLVILPDREQATLAAALAGADGVVLVGERPILTAELIAHAPRLRIAARMGAGTDNFDIPALTAHGIPLLTTGGANAGTVAEHAIYLLLALAKRGPARDRAVKSGAWPRGFGAVELAGATALLVGYGRIGRAIAQRLRGFDMTILVVDPHLSAAAQDGVEIAPSLQAALPRADAVLLACALTTETRNLIGPAELQLMKPTAFLVNVARGPVVNEAALMQALKDGQLAGAGLDVLCQEPPERDNPLLGRDDVVLTPHTASHVATTYARMSRVAAQAVLDALDGRLNHELVANYAMLRRNKL